VDSIPAGRVSRRSAVAGFLAVTLIALLSMASGAKAAELLYWDNYASNGLAFANLDGSGGGSLNLSGAELLTPEGMAYDSASNRIFVASSDGGAKGQIIFVNLDGSGAGVLGAVGAAVDSPNGVAIDPGTRTVYWINRGFPESIGWTKLDGSGGGLLNTTGATLAGPYRLSIDPLAGRVYWGNASVGKVSISYANVDNTGGGNLSLAGATLSNDISGLAVVPSLGRLYWFNSDRVSFASLSGGGGGDLNLAGANLEGAYGLAVDPTTAKLYWGNFGHHVGSGAFSFGNLAGGGGTFSIGTTLVNGPQDPLIIKSPSGTSAPSVTRSNKSRSALSCSTGAWAADLSGSSVYQAPRTFAYQWTRDGGAIAGATATTFTATTPGSYGCTVSATNQAGSTALPSKAVKVDASKLKLILKTRKVTAKPGKPAVFKVQALNQGDLKPRNARLCVKVPRSARKDLKAKCGSLGKLKPGGKRPARLKVKIGASASGVYKLKIQVRGSAGKPVKATLRVIG
jgi:hypothetical protein